MEKVRKLIAGRTEHGGMAGKLKGNKSSSKKQWLSGDFIDG